MDRQLQRIFRFLGIKYPPNDVEPILNIILTGKEEQRIHAIEFLDNILDNQLKKELIPIAESVLVEAISEEKIKERVAKAEKELSYAKEFDQVLINDDLEIAKAEAFDLVSNFIQK